MADRRNLHALFFSIKLLQNISIVKLNSELVLITFEIDTQLRNRNTALLLMKDRLVISLLTCIIKYRKRFVIKKDEV